MIILMDGTKTYTLGPSISCMTQISICVTLSFCRYGISKSAKKQRQRESFLFLPFAVHPQAPAWKNIANSSKQWKTYATRSLSVTMGIKSPQQSSIRFSGFISELRLCDQGVGVGSQYWLSVSKSWSSLFYSKMILSLFIFS